MYYTVIPYSTVNREAYASLLEECPWASPFHSLEWMQIYALFSRKACQFLICAEEGDDLLAAMPVTVFEKFYLHAVFSNGFGVHGGPICRTECRQHVISGLLKTFVSEFHGSRTILSSVQDFSGLGSSLKDWGFSPTIVSTHVMPIPEKYEKLDKKARKDARKPAKAGITINRSKNAGDFEQWQQLCSANYVAHGRRPYPSALYRAVAELVDKTDTFRFHIAKLDGRIVGGTITVYAMGQVYGWMSATDKEFGNLAINDGILQVVVQDAIAEGIARFDLGPSPMGAEGLIHFKEKWGGIRKDYHQYSYASALGTMGANLVRYGRIPWG